VDARGRALWWYSSGSEVGAWSEARGTFTGASWGRPRGGYHSGALLQASLYRPLGPACRGAGNRRTPRGSPGRWHGDRARRSRRVKSSWSVLACGFALVTAARSGARAREGDGSLRVRYDGDREASTLLQLLETLDGQARAREHGVRVPDGSGVDRPAGTTCASNPASTRGLEPARPERVQPARDGGTLGSGSASASRRVSRPSLPHAPPSRTGTPVVGDHLKVDLRGPLLSGLVLGAGPRLSPASVPSSPCFREAPPRALVAL